MTSSDGIIFCPTCNKSFFNPGFGKKFTCQNCGTQIIVNEDLLMRQQGKTEVNKVRVDNKPNTNLAHSDSSNFVENKTDDGKAQAIQNANLGLNSNLFSSDNNSDKNSFSENIFNKTDSQQETSEKFPHKAFKGEDIEQTKKEETIIKDDASNKKVDEQSDTLFDESQFELATSDKSLSSNDKNKKDKKDKKGEKSKDNAKAGKSNLLSYIAISLMFVLALVAIYYFVVIPLIVPSYEKNWNKYISAQNELCKSQGIDKKINTIEFNVDSKTEMQITATIKVEEKTFNIVTDKYDNEIITYTAVFVKKGGEFVLTQPLVVVE